ncbi:adenylosuccinate lyase, partial [Candidatus Peregrinibacteria bacterium]|nr:adenylosuccinate lyase [Candidatus Peregrinibacteria bacterium]
TTVGKRAAMWCQDFVLSLKELEMRRSDFPLRGLKGATGTQASFLTLFNGDTAKVDDLERRFVQKIGGSGHFPITGQVYPRIVDTQITGSLGLVAQAAHKMCNDVRFLAFRKEMDEPDEDGKVGSTAMAYKKNPTFSERATGLSRYLASLPGIAAQTASAQFLERTLDDSSNRRIVLPEAALTCDSILLILTYVARGMKLYPAMIRKHLRDELPFMATDAILMDGVMKGGDRQKLHEAIRAHSKEAGRRVKELALDNDLVDRLKGDPLFEKVDIDAVLDPALHIGRAPEQVVAFIDACVKPIRAKYAATLGMNAEMKV